MLGDKINTGLYSSEGESSSMPLSEMAIMPTGQGNTGKQKLKTSVRPMEEISPTPEQEIFAKPS